MSGKTRPAIAALLLAVAPASAHAAPEAALRRAMEALGIDDVETARAIVDPLLASDPSDPAVAYVAGVLRFHEQRYPEAVSLLERSGEGKDVGYLALARATREVTAGHARAEGEHFTVSYPKGKDEVLVPYLLEALEAERRALVDDVGAAPEGKVTVEILPDTRALSRVSTLTDDEIKTSGTIAVCKFNKLMVVSPKALLHGYDWLDTAAHEYVHHVVTRRTLDRAPIWLQEGLAKYEETRWRGAAGEALSPYGAALAKDAARRGKLITFAEMHPSLAKLPSQEAAALAFSEVVLAVETLVERGGRPVLRRVLDLVAAGRGVEVAVAEALGVPFERFVAEWKRHLLTRPLPRGGDAELRRLRFKGDPKHGGTYSEWSEISDAQARGLARLGEIFRERGKWEPARLEYEKAMRRLGGTRVAALADKLAVASMMVGRDAEAEAALAEAIRIYPQHAALHVHLARVHLKRKAWGAARDELLLANRTDPFDPEIHAGLAAALEALGQNGDASRERRFAQILVGHGNE